MDEGNDLVALERIFLGVVMADTDEKFEAVIYRTIPNVILKLSSPNEEVKNKVVELLSHISKRVKATKSVQLPVETLISHYADPEASNYIINFSIIYIKIGFPRLPKEKKIELLPKLLSAVSNKPLPQQECVLVLLLSSLSDHVLPRDENIGKNLFSLGDKEELRKLLLNIISDVFMFPYGCMKESTLAELSAYSFKRLMGDGFIDVSADGLEKLKANCVQLVNCGLYTPTEQYPVLVLASADPRASVSQAAESCLKRLARDVDTNDLKPISYLYEIYLGIDGKGGGIEKKRPHLSMRVRLKILQHLAKFTAILWPAALKVLFDSLYGSFTNNKLRLYALNYASMLIKHVELSSLSSVAPVILESGLIKIVKEPGADQSLKEKVYPLIGQLVRRVPSLVSKNLSLLEFMFNEIEEAGESETARLIRDSAVSMCHAYLSQDDLPLAGLVELKLSSPVQKCRSLALTYAANGLPHTPLRTYILLTATCLNDDEIRKQAKKLLDYRQEDSVLNSDKSATKPGGFTALMSLVLERDFGKKHPPLLLKEIVLYLRLCLAADAGVESNGEQLVHPSEASPLISAYLKKQDPTLIQSYLELLFRLLKEDSGAIPLTALLEIIGCLYPQMADKLQDKMSTFKKLTIEGSSDGVRETAGQIWGLLASRVEPPPLAEMESHVLPLAHLLSRLDDPPLTSLETVCQSLTEPSSQLAGLAAVALVAQSGRLRLNEARLDSLLDTLIGVSLQSESMKGRERALTAAAHILSEQESTRLRSKIINRLLESPKEMKDIEVVLAGGQCLVAAVLGVDGPLAGDPWTRTKPQGKQSEGAPGLLAAAVEKVLSTLVTDRRPTVRQTLCFWLLALTKHCSNLDTLKVKLAEIQNGFIDLLTDNSSLVQEGAGKGLALVYEAGDEDTRQELVKKVVEQLGSGKRQGQVSEDTKLFEEGEVGQGPSGEKLTTYRELCNLVSDLNQPDLIYKFMALAHHNAIWNSKKGAALTVASIVKKAGAEADQFLPSALIKLYRYQYDPVGHVRQAMAGIWSSLATPETLVKYRKEIFDDLLTNLTAREWRVRYSSCRAICDLMKGPSGTFLQQEKKDRMPELWKELFRVMDDIHKDTRYEAAKTATSLAKVCAGSVVLPVILEKGITSNVAEVRLLSLAMVNEMLKKGLPEEDVVRIVVSYLKNEMDPKPFAQYIKGSMLPDLNGPLIDALKHSIRGRVNIANLMTILSHQLTQEEVQPYVGKWLGALLPGMKDKQRRVRTEFGSTVGHLLRVAKPSSVERLVERLVTYYLEANQEDEVKWGVLEAVDSSIKHSQESVEEVVLPLVFLAKHEAVDPDKTNLKRVERWEEAYKQICPGAGRLTMYSKEVVALLLTAVKSQFWGLKAQGGRSIRSLAEKVTELPQKGELLEAVLEALEGRAWDGKESLLTPLPLLGDTERVREVLLRECSRGNDSYKVTAMTTLGETSPQFRSVSEVVRASLEGDSSKQKEAALGLIGKSNVTDAEWVEVAELCLASLDSSPAPCLEALSQICRGRTPELLRPLIVRILEAVASGLGARKQSRTRKAALGLLHVIKDDFKGEKDALAQMRQTYEKFSVELESDTDLGVRSRANDIKEGFQNT